MRRSLTLRNLAVYTCGGQNGSIPVKTSQGNGFYEKNSCMVIEMEGVIDGEPLDIRGT